MPWIARKKPTMASAGRHEGGQEQLRDVLLGQNRVDDERDRRRHQDAERSPGRQGPGGERAGIAVFAHFRQRDLAHRRRGGQRGAADRAEGGAGADRRHRHAAAIVTEQCIGAAEQPRRQAGARGDVAHQQKQRDDRKRIGGEGVERRRLEKAEQRPPDPGSRRSRRSRPPAWQRRSVRAAQAAPAECRKLRPRRRYRQSDIAPAQCSPAAGGPIGRSSRSRRGSSGHAVGDDQDEQPARQQARRHTASLPGSEASSTCRRCGTSPRCRSRAASASIVASARYSRLAARSNIARRRGRQVPGEDADQHVDRAELAQGQDSNRPPPRSRAGRSRHRPECP